ncbi:MAG: hypothetical protein BJ554DRAFT_1986, partial [Olpidium bornovanus]
MPLGAASAHALTVMPEFNSFVREHGADRHDPGRGFEARLIGVVLELRQEVAHVVVGSIAAGERPKLVANELCDRTVGLRRLLSRLFGCGRGGESRLQRVVALR